MLCGCAGGSKQKDPLKNLSEITFSTDGLVCVLTIHDGGCTFGFQEPKTLKELTVIYDGRFEQQRLRITGKVGKVDHYWKTLEINKIGIDFSEIQEILT